METYINCYDNCRDVKVNSIILIKDKVGKVTDFTVHKSGKHGGAKKAVTAIDLFNDTKIIHTFSTTDKIPVPFCEKKKYLFVCVDDNVVTVIDDNNDENKFDLICNDDIKKKIKDYDVENGLELEILCCIGKHRIISVCVLRN